METASVCDIPIAGGTTADVIVGFGGGVMGGLAGLAGPLPIVWATFKPWSRDEKRALFQIYNLVILSATVCSSAIAGLLPSKFWLALLICVPATVIGVQAGFWAYRRLDDRRYDRVVVSLLLVMGFSLIVTSW